MNTYRFKVIFILIFTLISFSFLNGQSIGPQIISSMSMNFQQTNGYMNCVVGDIVNFSEKDSDDNFLGVGYTSCIVYIENMSSISPVNIDINVYPNPTNEILFIELDYSDNFIQIEMTDILGKQLLLEKYSGISDKININLSDFNIGTYFLLLKDQKGNSIGQYKIIKQ